MVIPAPSSPTSDPDLGVAAERPAPQRVFGGGRGRFAETPINRSLRCQTASL